MLNAAVPLDTDSKTTSGAPANLRLVEPSSTAVEPAIVQGRSYSVFTPAKLEAFVAVAEEGGFSAAARRLRISRPLLCLKRSMPSNVDSASNCWYAAPADAEHRGGSGTT